jgi:hypothetical protein
MTEAEELFHKIAREVPEAIEGKLFGAKCVKLNTGKTAVIFWKESMLFKLDEKVQQEALNLEGSKIGTHFYDPKKLMKGWISIPFKHSHTWIDFARKAIEFVKDY